jgi:hypothetical protein
MKNAYYSFEFVDDLDLNNICKEGWIICSPIDTKEIAEGLMVQVAWFKKAVK